MKRNERLPATALVQHFGAENVRRHQVGRELDALGVEPERDAERLDQLGLGEAGHADQQRMAAGQDRHQGVFDHPILAEDDGGDRFLRGADLAGDLFGRADDHVLELLDTVCASHPSLLDRQRRRLRRHAMNLMLNLCEGHVFVELNYPHIIGISGYERHHDVATEPTFQRRNSPSRRLHQSCQIEAKLRANNGEARADTRQDRKGLKG